MQAYIVNVKYFKRMNFKLGNGEVKFLREGNSTLISKLFFTNIHNLAVKDIFPRQHY